MISNERNNQWAQIWFLSFMGLLMTGTSLSVVAVEEGKDCIDLKAKAKFKGAVVHSPVSEGECMKCHNVHASDKTKLLNAAMPGLCFDCHDKLIKDAKERVLPSTKIVFEDTELKLHKPFADGDCACCHNPHASSHYRLLKQGRRTESFYTSYSKEKYLCFGCHSEKAFIEPRTLSETNFRNGNLNLHYRHVNRKKGRTCQSCHHHHGSKNAALIREQAAFGERNINITVFEKTEHGGKCSPSCHRTVRYDRLEPYPVPIKVTEREGEDATYEELLRAVVPVTKEPIIKQPGTKEPIIKEPVT